MAPQAAVFLPLVMLSESKFRLWLWCRGAPHCFTSTTFRIDAGPKDYSASALIYTNLLPSCDYGGQGVLQYNGVVNQWEQFRAFVWKFQNLWVEKSDSVKQPRYKSTGGSTSLKHRPRATSPGNVLQVNAEVHVINITVINPDIHGARYSKSWFFSRISHYNARITVTIDESNATSTVTNSTYMTVVVASTSSASNKWCMTRLK